MPYVSEPTFSLLCRTVFTFPAVSLNDEPVSTARLDERFAGVLGYLIILTFDPSLIEYLFNNEQRNRCGVT